MQDRRKYHITLRGRIDEAEFNQSSPVAVLLLANEVNISQICVKTDQSGLMGLLRYLHGRGYVLVSIMCESEKLDDRR